jgi:ornithine cyclodeaminase/alanine dehydrogenase-like protein (mu-crystallin family)
MKMNALFLTLEDVINAGGKDIELASKDVLRGFELFSKGKIILPPKTTLKQNSQEESIEGLVNFLPSLINVDGEEIISCKMMGSMPSNLNRGLPRATGLIVLFDASTKSPLCVMDAQVISAIRTGAVSLISAKKLARQDTEKVGLIGAGVNMRTQLLGVSKSLKNIKEVKVFSRGDSKYKFSKEMNELTGLNIIPVNSVKEAVQEADLIITCIANSSKPALFKRDIKNEGVTIFNIGCYESHEDIVASSDKIISDFWEYSKHRGVQPHSIAFSKKLIEDSQVINLGDILFNNVEGRENSSENIFFSPTGLGFEDGLVAWRVYKTALEKGIGKKIKLWDSTEWI